MNFPVVLQRENTSTILFQECKLLPEVPPTVSESFWSWVGSLQKKTSKSLNFGMHPGANNSIKKTTINNRYPSILMNAIE